MNVSAWAIRHPVPCILLFVLLGGAGLLAFRATPVQNFPDVDLPLVTVTASLPCAAPEQLETTVARPLEDAIATLDGLRHLYTTVQDGVVGIAAVVERELRSLPGVGQVSLQAALQRPEVRIRPDAARAADLGVTAAAIADTVRIATLGDHAQLLPRLDLGRRQVPVVTSLPAAATTDLDLLRQLTVPGESGAVPLREVADITFASGPAQISRLDRLRTINIDIALEGQAMGDIAGRIAALPSPSRLPAGLRLSGIGQAETSDEAGRGFVLAMLTGIACIYLVLVLLFGAWLQPLTILGALLLSLPGAILALLVTGTHL